MSSLLDHSPPSAQAQLPPLPQSNGQPAAAPPSSPIPSFQLRESISGSEFELLVQTFDDRIVVIVTQNGKMGCMTQASLPPFVPLPQPPLAPTSSPLSHFPPPPDSIALTPLLGSPPDRALNDTYVSQIATLIWWALQESQAPRRGVVIGLSLARKRGQQDQGEESGGVLEEEEVVRFKGVMEMVAKWPGP